MIYPLSDTCTALGKAIIKPDSSFSFLSYLLRGSKNVLIDTVPQRSGAVFLEELRSLLPLDSLDAVILNHSEEDHSGALDLLLEAIPLVPIYCTPQTASKLGEKYPTACFNIVENSSLLTIGDFNFQFIHTPGLHWDDNMVTLFKNEAILFSNDLFGQSLGAEIPLDSSFSESEVLSSAKAYFEKVFSSSAPHEKEVLSDILKLDIKLAAPGHGVILRDSWKSISEYYRSVCCN